MGGNGALVYSVYVDGFQCAMKEFVLEHIMEDTTMDYIDTELRLLESLPQHRNLVR